MPTTMVEVLITVSQDTQAELSDGEVKFTGAYVLRAFDAEGKVLHEARSAMPDLAVATSDCARLLILVAALDRLHSKLRNGKAWYMVRVCQSSKNVDGWLAHGWKRNATTVKELAGAVDSQLKPFHRHEFVRLGRAELEARLNVREEVMPTP